MTERYYRVREVRVPDERRPGDPARLRRTIRRWLLVAVDVPVLEAEETSLTEPGPITDAFEKFKIETYSQKD